MGRCVAGCSRLTDTQRFWRSTIGWMNWIAMQWQRKSHRFSGKMVRLMFLLPPQLSLTFLQGRSLEMSGAKWIRASLTLPSWGFRCWVVCISSIWSARLILFSLARTLTKPLGRYRTPSRTRGKRFVVWLRWRLRDNFIELTWTNWGGGLRSASYRAVVSMGVPKRRKMCATRGGCYRRLPFWGNSIGLTGPSWQSTFSPVKMVRVATLFLSFFSFLARRCGWRDCGST